MKRDGCGWNENFVLDVLCGKAAEIPLAPGRVGPNLGIDRLIGGSLLRLTSIRAIPAILLARDSPRGIGRIHYLRGCSTTDQTHVT
jgi:hypothetical protein